MCFKLLVGRRKYQKYQGPWFRVWLCMTANMGELGSVSPQFAALLKINHFNGFVGVASLWL